MNTTTIFLLVVLGWTGATQTVVVERFATDTACAEVAAQLNSLDPRAFTTGPRPAPNHHCVKATVVKP